MKRTQFGQGEAAARFGPGFDRTFRTDRTTLGLFFPIEAFDGPRPAMEDQIELAAEAERLGFSALWARDVPLDDPGFGDLGQIYDPFVWLATVAAHTSEIALATGSVILPLHHPVDVAKQAASLDHLSGGRLILGIASGDRPIEYPAYGRNRNERAELFRDALLYLKELLGTSFPTYESERYGRMHGGDLIPKPLHGRLPLLGTGNSGQPLQWLAEQTDGWITYPRPPSQQQRVVGEWHGLSAADAPVKPVAQSLYLDLAGEADAPPQPIHLGYRMGVRHLESLLNTLHGFGVHHVALNLKFSRMDVRDVLEKLSPLARGEPL
ncbi:5,10-methylene tetrahydromethanopterin reductase [Roseovarius sp. HI0049]|nr:5,10-methylene tetrahydromethanopterin reductase [Roseovarius sp. HI0049]